MKNKYFKIIGSILTIAFFMFISFGSGESKKSEPKTNFATSAELWEYIQGENYNTLKGVWGEGRVGQPWVSSPTGDMGVSINVYWDNVTCEGKPIKVRFKNDSSYDSTRMTPNPSEVQAYNLKGEGAY